MSILLFLKLLLAHVLADFVFQPTKWVEEKKDKSYKSLALYMHTGLHALLAYVLVMDWTNWQIPMMVLAFHTVIDIWKSHQKKNTFYFVLDQLLHVASLVIITLLVSHESAYLLWNFINTPTVLVIIIAYILVLKPYSFIIDLFTEKWRNEIRQIEKKDAFGSLEDAGKYIGMFERFLVLTFMLSGNAGAIGMLIAAKSILRFNDLKGESSRKMSEYVLIGTLLSFSLCIVTGLIVSYLIKDWG